MSFRFKGCVCSLNNYVSIFKGLNSDFIDEIRLAILDDTPIGDYISVLVEDKDGARKLSQIRKALREYVPLAFITTEVSAEVMEYIRLLYAERGEAALDQLSPYIKLGVSPELSDKTLKEIITVLYHGVDISKVNFNNVETANVSVVASGLIKGYPMWLVAEMPLDTDYMQVLIQGMKVGVDVHPFLIGDWDIECVKYLISQVRRVNLSEILENVNCNFNIEQLKEVISAALSNVDFGLLCLKEDGGQPVFNEYQMEVVKDCLVADVLTEEIYDYNKSDMDMRDLYNIEISKKKGNKRLGGSLKH